MPLPKDWRAFIESLNSNGVEYLVVGAVALAHHGYPRYTGDLDILIRSSETNGRRLEAALEAFGFGQLGLAAGDFIRPERVIQLGVAPNRIDLLTSITGVSFDEAWAGRSPAEVDGVPVNFIGRAELIRNKRSTARARDRADVSSLEGER